MKTYIHFIIWITHTSLLSLIDCLTISTTTGVLQGRMVFDDMFDTCYHSYERIPYAEPPVGDLRFRPPVPKEPWTGVLDARRSGRVCPQFMTIPFDEKISEDCLFLNVFTPVNISKELLPIVFLVHPGDLEYNSGNAEDLCGPQLMVKNNNILVTLNYRLGALGFLSFENIEASGNAGIKDVLLALNWVKKNIERFGGDPNLITIMGYGAGAAIAHTLLLTDKTDGLLHGAALYDGSVTSPKYFQNHPTSVAIQLCLELGFEISETTSLIQQLKEVDIFSIIKAQRAIAKRDPQRGFRNYIPFGITAEIETSTAIITRKPIELIKEGIKQNIPITTGFDNQAGLDVFPMIKKDPSMIDRLNLNPELLIPSDIEYPPGSMRRDLALSIKKFYFNDDPISVATTQRFVDLVTDTSYAFSVDSWLLLHTRRVDSAPVYYYVFPYDSLLNWDKVAENITYPGAAPTDELGYFFVTKFTRSAFATMNSNLRRFVDQGLLIISNFVRYGNPTPCPCEGTTVWPEAGPNRIFRYLAAVSEFFTGPPYPRRLNFWYDVYERYYQYQNSQSDLSQYS